MIHLGYSQGQRFVREKGNALPDEEESLGSEFSESIDNHEFEFASKYYRFFARTEGNIFALFVEHGINRKYEVQLLEDQQTISLKLEIPIPPDELLKQAKMHATMVSLQPVVEDFEVVAPGKLDPNTKEVISFPTKKTPIWTVFKYNFQKQGKVEEAVKIEIDLTDLFMTNGEI